MTLTEVTQLFSIGASTVVIVTGLHGVARFVRRRRRRTLAPGEQ